MKREIYIYINTEKITTYVSSIKWTNYNHRLINYNIYN